MNDFGGLVALWVMDSLFGHRVASELTLLFVAADLVRHVVLRRPIPVLWWLVNGLMSLSILAELTFGLSAIEPWEGTATNALFALMFFAGAFMRPPVIQRLAEYAQKAPFPERRDITLFFRYLTLLWSGLFWVVTLLDVCLSTTHFAGKYGGIVSTGAPVLAVGIGILVSRRWGRSLFRFLSGKGAFGPV
ncbi:hypothetical protein AA21952_1885 [Acetobacter oeni LMG 21952]|nr:hypothetical protein AA21952_1885 [Acetobacter oeni LMG 21952]